MDWRFGPTLACAAAVVSASLLDCRVAFAADEFTYPEPERRERESFGMAEFGVGLLALPGAEVCVERTEAGCSKGDQTLAVSAWPLFRFGRFVLGAGVVVGLTPTTDAPRNDPPEIPRDHKRSYFTVEAASRYYIPLTESLEGFVGLNAGLVVVNDTFSSDKAVSDFALIGPQGATLLTEGATIGVGAGLNYKITDNWVLGGSLKLSSWFLPREPDSTVFGDEASLNGRITTVELGLSVAYRSRF
jgi:hypothetical protein